MAKNPINWNDTNPAAPATGTTDDGVNVHYQGETPDADITVPRDASSYIKPLDILLAAKSDKTVSSYTILSTDFRKQLVFHDTSPVAPVAVAVPQAGTTGFPAKYYAFLLNLTTTTVTLTPATSTINGASTLVLSANGGCLLISDGTNWTALPFGGGGFTNPMTTLGDIIYEDASLAAVRLAGNITTARKFLRQVGTGTVSAVPAWDTVTATDVGLGNVTNDAQAKAATTITTTAPLTIDSGTSANLSANRTLAVRVFVASGGSHASGIVPDPGASAGTSKFLREDATFATPAGSTGSGGYPGSSFTDDFSSTGTSATIWGRDFPASVSSNLYNEGGTISQSGSQLSITPGVARSAVGYVTLVPYNLRGKRFAVKVTQRASSSTGVVQTYLGLSTGIPGDPANFYHWIEQSGTLFAQMGRVGTGGGVSTKFSVAYSAVTHLWWGISELNDTISWDTSTDGITWTSRATNLSFLSIQKLYMEIAVGCDSSATGINAALFNSASVA